MHTILDVHGWLTINHSVHRTRAIVQQEADIHGNQSAPIVYFWGPNPVPYETLLLFSLMFCQLVACLKSCIHSKQHIRHTILFVAPCLASPTQVTRPYTLAVGMYINHGNCDKFHTSALDFWDSRHPVIPILSSRVHVLPCVSHPNF